MKIVAFWGVDLNSYFAVAASASALATFSEQEKTAQTLAEELFDSSV